MSDRGEDAPGGRPPPEGRERLSASETAAPSPGSPPRPAPAGASGTASGSVVAQFELLDLLGAGGFGEVYRARDNRLGRMVAIKVLPAAFEKDPERRERFRREALAASALNHPNICTVFDLVEEDGRSFIVMELVEGKTLSAALKDGPLPFSRLLPIALQVAEALGEAHRAGILHRDVKPGNIALDSRGRVKVLDFGLAKVIGSTADREEATLEKLTVEGTTAGTLEFMSPEQLLGRPLDRRSDLFSFGVVLYATVTGRLPFGGGTPIALADAILHAEPRDLSDAPVPDRLKAVLRKLLEKEPAKRYASAEEVQAELRALEESLAPGPPAGLSRNARIGLVALAAAAVAFLAVGGWLWHRSSRERWAREATAEAARLVEAEEFAKAFALVRQAREVLPEDPTLEKLWLKATGEVTVESAPPGAEVSIRPYRGDPDAWESLGATPLRKVRRPNGQFLLRVTVPGHVPALRVCAFRGWNPPPFTFRLDREGTIPNEVVRIPAGKVEEVELDDYLMDRTEVTNAQYKAFVDAGGYEKPEYWQQPFVEEGHSVSLEEAIGRFRDATGRPGPAGWELGRFPAGREEHPVTGVSWFEAAAYAEFAGKSLPTVSHWRRAAAPWWGEVVCPGSNFTGPGTVPVGSGGAVGEFGTYDMAGNAKEWCWNEMKDHRRLILGGGFGEPAYMYIATDAQSPWRREPSFGFRCVKLTGKAPEATLGTVDERPSRDYAKEKPASDEAFRAYKGLYAYDRRDLAARVEETAQSDDWTTELVSFDAGYGNERMLAYFCLPRNARPPFQAVFFFPGGPSSGTKEKPDLTREGYADLLLQSGRALLFPVFKGTFQRSDELDDSTDPSSALWRDHVIAWGKDLQRSVDFLETRKEIDPEKLAYFGFSWGGSFGPVMLAVEDRFRVAILVSGGLKTSRRLPEADPINFVSRARVPVLVLSGRYDHINPLGTAQLPLFRLLGTPAKDKRHVVFESGHAPPRKDVIRESLDWLDRYLGPVKR